MSQRLNEALLQPATGPTDIFGVAYLQLCQISYALPSAIPGLVNTKMPPLGAGGRWACVWGPVESDDLANIVFVAAYYDGPNLPPTFAAVVTRGTDADVDDVWGVCSRLLRIFTLFSRDRRHGCPGEARRLWLMERFSRWRTSRAFHPAASRF